MERLETRLDGPILARPRVLRDERGFFQESYRRTAWAELGVREELVQENHSRSGRGVVRGLHLQSGVGRRGMAKLVRCVHGSILDVVVDLRRSSPTFAEWEAFVLDDDNLHQLYCPSGFAHGFCTLSEEADVVYKCDDYYDPEHEWSIAYNDPDLAIEWPPGLELRTSARDAAAPPLREVADRLAPA